MAESFGLCALCRQPKELHASHIIPAFAFRWLKQRSATAHIRSVDNPNIRVQDGDKPRMLCCSCEGKFSRWESVFFSKMFKPVMRGSDSIEYEGWLLPFCTSLSWRVLKHCKDRNPDSTYSDRQIALSVEAEQRWRAYLTGNNRSIGQFKQHILVFTELRGMPFPGLPQNINRYLFGGIEMDIIGSKNRLLTFAKIGRIALFGVIQDRKEGWQGTHVRGQHGIVTAGRFSAPRELGEYFAGRARVMHETINVRMSEAQRMKASSD